MRVLVTGAEGFLGHWVVKHLRLAGHDVAAPARRDFDLLRPGAAYQWFLGFDQEVGAVVHLAALCGGIGLNQARPADLLYANAVMGLNVLEAARQTRIKRVVMLGTTCSYPRDCPVPFREEALWDGYPEETNAPYGLANKMMLVQLQAYREQYGFDGIIS